MSGGLMQIVAQGAQDKYLTVNPEITFFKSMYRRHTNFAMESIEQTFNGSQTANGKVSATISRNGDLVHRMWLEYTPSANHTTGHTIYDRIDNVSIEIGGTRVDRHTGRWLKLSDDLRCPEGKRTNLTKSTTAQAANTLPLRVPLSFWFCRDAGSALPLIALQYHEVKVSVELTASFAGTMSLWVDYIYLDTAERQRFARSGHQYLIEQVQSTGDETLTAGSNKIRLDFNHPVKELVWSGKDATAQTELAKTTGLTKAVLRLNGHDRFASRDAEYFRRVQQYQHHTGNAEAFVYSFALEPEKLQPSGTCNFSRIDNATLELTAGADGDTEKVVVFAVNYNVLRIKNGMGGLAYSN